VRRAALPFSIAVPTCQGHLNPALCPVCFPGTPPCRRCHPHPLVRGRSSWGGGWGGAGATGAGVEGQGQQQGEEEGEEQQQGQGLQRRQQPPAWPRPLQLQGVGLLGGFKSAYLRIATAGRAGSRRAQAHTGREARAGQGLSGRENQSDAWNSPAVGVHTGLPFLLGVRGVRSRGSLTVCRATGCGGRRQLLLLSCRCHCCCCCCWGGFWGRFRRTGGLQLSHLPGPQELQRLLSCAGGAGQGQRQGGRGGGQP